MLEVIQQTRRVKSSCVRAIDVLSDGPEPNKRAFLRGAVAAGGSLPAMYFLLDRHGEAAAKTVENTTVSASGSEGTGSVRIVRDFSNNRTNPEEGMRSGAIRLVL